MAIILREADVKKLANMEMALEAVGDAFRLQGEGSTENTPRRRCRLDDGLLHVMSASLPTLGWAGIKSYTSIGGKARFLVFLYGGEGGQLLAIIEADLLGQLRTGAASGIASRHMARPGSSRLGIIGTGYQARAQLAAVCAVCPVKTVTAYGRDQGRREAFCAEMSDSLGLHVEPASDPELAVRDMDIVITATNSKEPVLSGE